MLKQIRHISEGNFYGLHVTNKARKLSLDKEIRTLEACKDVQSHVYRKEERELLSTLKRLQHTNQDHFEDSEHHENQERFAFHPERRPSFEANEHTSDEQRHLRRQTKCHDRKLQVTIKSEISDKKTSVKVCAGPSDASVIILLSPIASSTNATKQLVTTALPSVTKPTKREAGSDIRRTQAFMSCVVCNLPRDAQGREYKHICTCHDDPSKHPHHHHKRKQDSHKHSKKHEDLHCFKGERRRSLEVEENPPHYAWKQGFKNTNILQSNHGRSRASSIEDDNKRYSEKGVDAYTAYVPGVGAHRWNFGADQGIVVINDHENDKGKQSALRASRGKKKSLEEGGSRKNRYSDRRSRGSSFGEEITLHKGGREGGSRRNSHSHRRSRGSSFGEDKTLHNRTKQKEELRDLYHRLQRMFPVHDRHEYHDEDSNWPRRYTNKPENLPHTTHLSLFTPHTASTSNERAEHQNPAFNGLLHPDNVVNHHHFLPHEAYKQDKPGRSSHHAPHHLTGYHVHGIDRHGNRQDHYVTQGPTSHIAAAFDRSHDQDSGIHSMLMKLKQLLNVYHEMDREAPRYPWPSPPQFT